MRTTRLTESRRRMGTESGVRFRRRVSVNEQGRWRQPLPFSVDAHRAMRSLTALRNSGRDWYRKTGSVSATSGETLRRLLRLVLCPVQVESRSATITDPIVHCSTGPRLQRITSLRSHAFRQYSSRTFDRSATWDDLYRLLQLFTANSPSAGKVEATGEYPVCLARSVKQNAYRSFAG